MKGIDQVLGEVGRCVRQVSSESLVQTTALIEEAPRIFVVGAGRTGLCMRALGMRLMQLGIPTFVVGETTTPALVDGDLLLLGSASGKTTTLLPIAGQAEMQGATTLLFTADTASPLAGLADHHILIPAPLDDMDGKRSVQPLGTLFEQSLLLLGDTLILNLMERMDVGAAQMAERHANLQ